MKKISALHVASFTGNIGDNANHTGFRKKLRENLGIDIVYTEFEIREVFWKNKSFDINFVNLANKHDLIIIGGGNYFELWVDDSASGTSIDISLELLSKIDTPIVFNALGVDPAQGASEENVKKFRRFLDYAIASPTIMLSCRNDGSMKALKEFVGIDYAKAFYHVPDAGLFTEVKDCYHPEINEKKKNVVIQLAGDMLETRFPKNTPTGLDEDEFLASLVDFLIQLHQLGVHFIFVPHIFRDLKIIDDVIQRLPDNIRRRDMSVAPYVLGQKGQDYIFDLYRKSDLVLGMRFHANVCSVGLGTPCVGLSNYRQIEEFYDEMGMNEFRVQVNVQGFEQDLYNLSKGLLEQSINAPKGLLEPWSTKLDLFHLDIKSWLADLGLL